MSVRFEVFPRPGRGPNFASADIRLLDTGIELSMHIVRLTQDATNAPCSVHVQCLKPHRGLELTHLVRRDDKTPDLVANLLVLTQDEEFHTAVIQPFVQACNELDAQAAAGKDTTVSDDEDYC